MEKCDGIVLDINVICAILGENVYSCLLYLLIADVTQHHGHQKIKVLNNLFARDYHGLVNVLGDGNIKHANMVEAAKPFCIALYDKLRYTVMES